MNSQKRVGAEGIEIALGNLDDENSLFKAMDNVYGVFTILAVSLQKDKEQEIKQAQTLVKACEKAGVQVLIHTSVSCAWDEENWDNYEKNYPFSYLYWVNKAGSVKVIKESKLPHWVILKPAWMMDNFLSDKASSILPSLKDGVFEASIKPETKLNLICSYDQAKFAKDAFGNIEKYDKQEVVLANAKITPIEMTALSKVLGKEIKAFYTEPEKFAVKKWFFKPLVDSYDWNNFEGYKVDLEKTKEKGIEMISFEGFCRMYKNRIEVL